MTKFPVLVLDDPEDPTIDWDDDGYYDPDD